MDAEAFRKSLKRKGKAPHVVDKIVSTVQAFETYLQKHHSEITLDQAGVNELEAYVAWIEDEVNQSARIPLWSIIAYYQYTDNQEMKQRAAALREQRISRKRRPYSLAKFMGVNPEHIKKLARFKLTNVEQMLKEGGTPRLRASLAKKTGIPLVSIEDLVRLSDLSRIFGVKGIRARLYVDMGIHSIPMMAVWNPEELRLKATEFVEKTGFKGVPPLPKEAAHSVKTAKTLPKLVEW